MHRRRTFFTLAAASTLAASGAPPAAADDTGDGVSAQQGGALGAALRRFLALPGTKSYLIHVGRSGSLRRVVHRPDLLLFTASAYKTFVLGQYLRDVEAGRLAED